MWAPSTGTSTPSFSLSPPANSQNITSNFQIILKLYFYFYKKIPLQQQKCKEIHQASDSIYFILTLYISSKFIRVIQLISLKVTPNTNFHGAPLFLHLHPHPLAFFLIYRRSCMRHNQLYIRWKKLYSNSDNEILQIKRLYILYKKPFLCQ